MKLHNLFESNVDEEIGKRLGTKRDRFKSLRKEDQEGSLNEFSLGGDDDDTPKDDPYKYPKPEQYRRSIDFFGKFEANHFDKEDMDDATGVFKGYWYYGNKLKQIAYFKFNNPQRTGSDDPGMGWYYEPQDDEVAEATGDEKFDKIMRKATGNITPADAAGYWPTREYEPINLDPSYLPSMAKYKAQLYPLAYNWWSDGGDGTEEAQLRKLGWEPSYGDDYVMVVLSGIGHDGHIQYDIHDFDADNEDLNDDVAEAKAATASFRAGDKKRAKLNSMSDEERRAYDKEQQEKQRKRDDARLERERSKNKGVAEGYDEFDDEEESDLRSGSYVRDKEDSSGEVFIMRGDPYERRVQITDRHGSGWNISPSRLIAVDDNDPAIAKYFGRDLAEISDKTRNSYVDKATSDYGHANFAARASKSHPGLEKYGQEQEYRAKKRAAGLNRALSDKRLGKNVDETQINEKSKSQAQFRTMAAVAHNPKFAKKVGISQKVGKEFHSADRKQDYKDLPKEVEEGKFNELSVMLADYHNSNITDVKFYGMYGKTRQQVAKEYEHYLEEGHDEAHCNMTNENELCPIHGLAECGMMIREAVSSLELAQALFSGLEQKYPDVVRNFGHEVVGDAVMDAAEESGQVHSMSDIDMIIDDIYSQLAGSNDEDEFTSDFSADDDSMYEGDEEVDETMLVTPTSVNINEARMYYNVVGTSGPDLRSDFGMRKDQIGWFLTAKSGSKRIMEAQRAFGTPKVEGYDLAGFSGSTQVKGPDNEISPIGTVPKGQMKKAKKNG